MAFGDLELRIASLNNLVIQQTIEPHKLTHPKN